MDRAEFDRFVDGLPSPMQVVTTVAGGERSGCLVGFASQVGIDPPRYLVGRVLERHAWGDHTAHLLEPLRVEIRGGAPGLDLTDVEDVEPGHEP